MKALHALIAGLALLAFAPVAALAEQPRVSTRSTPQILVIGDSLLASHKISQRNVAGRLSNLLDAPVADHSVGGARMIYNLPITGAMGLSIPRQWRKGEWDWVVMNGGGNDLWLGCGCSNCDHKLDRLIAEDGRRGAIPSLVQKIRRSGAQVLIVGYLRSPGFSSPIESCKDEGDALEARIARLAGIDPGVHFHSLTDLVPHGDLSFHGIDRIHPSLKASDAIARRLAQVISQAR